MFLLDTNAWIYFRKGTFPALTQRIHQQSPDDLFVPVVTLAEIQYGLSQLEPELAIRKRREWQTLLHPFEVLPVDEPVAEVWGRTRFATKKQPIGDRDALIAAIALVHGLTLITSNTSEFQRVPGLRVMDWTHP